MKTGYYELNLIERRTERRKRVRVKVYLQLRCRTPASCEAINISPSGALIKPRGRLVRLGERVSLVVAFAHGNVVRTYHRKAIVVHISNAGVGLRTYRHRQPTGQFDNSGYSSTAND